MDMYRRMRQGAIGLHLYTCSLSMRRCALRQTLAMSTQPVRISNRYKVTHTAATALHGEDQHASIAHHGQVEPHLGHLTLVRSGCGSCLPSCKWKGVNPGTTSVVSSFLHLLTYSVTLEQVCRDSLELQQIMHVTCVDAPAVPDFLRSCLPRLQLRI